MTKPRRKREKKLEGWINDKYTTQSVLKRLGTLPIFHKQPQWTLSDGKYVKVEIIIREVEEVNNEG